MIDKAEARCHVCGAPLSEDGECPVETCPSNHDTIRPRHSHPHPIRKPGPSGTFRASESTPSTFGDFLRGAGANHWMGELDQIPSGPRVPQFTEDELDESESHDPPTRRDLPTWRGPVPPPKPPTKR